MNLRRKRDVRHATKNTHEQVCPFALCVSFLGSFERSQAGQIGEGQFRSAPDRSSKREPTNEATENIVDEHRSGKSTSDRPREKLRSSSGFSIFADCPDIHFL